MRPASIPDQARPSEFFKFVSNLKNKKEQIPLFLKDDWVWILI